MKKTLLLAIFSVFMAQVFGQIGGLSASKLSAFNVDAVPTHKAEIEPSFDSYWLKDTLGKPYYKHGSSLRFTYGFNTKMEAGFITNLNFSAVQIGSKFKIFENKSLAIGLMGGMNFDFTLHSQPVSTVAGGIIGSFTFKPGFSLDANLIFDKNFPGNCLNASFVADIGYYFGIFQPIFEIAYSDTYILGKKIFEKQLSTSLGFTFEPGKNFLVVVGVPYYFTHNNETPIAGFNIAITISLN